MFEALKQAEGAANLLYTASGVAEALAILVFVGRTVMWQAAHYPHQFKWVRSWSFLPLQFTPFTRAQRVRHVVWMGFGVVLLFSAFALGVLAYEVEAEGGEDHPVTTAIKKNMYAW